MWFSFWLQKQRTVHWLEGKNYELWNVFFLWRFFWEIHKCKMIHNFAGKEAKKEPQLGGIGTVYLKVLFICFGFFSVKKNTKFWWWIFFVVKAKYRKKIASKARVEREKSCLSKQHFMNQKMWDEIKWKSMLSEMFNNFFPLIPFCLKQKCSIKIRKFIQLERSE